jgi:hypothetical protein
MEENNVETTEATAVESAEAVENTAPADDIIKAETVFFVVKNTDGSFKAITNVGQKIELARPANLQDIRLGCHEIGRALDARQTADTVLALLAAASKKQEPQE